MTITAVVRQFFESPAGNAILVVFGLSVLKFALGAFAAVRDNVFRLDVVAAWVRKDVAGRVLPIIAVLLVGHMTGGLDFEDGLAGLVSAGTILTGIGIGAAAIYVLEIVGSIRESLTPKPAVDIRESNVREVPQD